MTEPHTAPSRLVGISVSESPDLPALGLSDGHLRDAMAEIALGLLSGGASLAYGGDLRRYGFTECLARLIDRYQGHPRHREQIGATDYVAWPVHIGMARDELASFATEHECAVHLVLLSLGGAPLSKGSRWELSSHEPCEEEWTKGLTAMRKAMCHDIRARVVLGGRVEGYKGAMPGIAEEARLSLEAGQPLFVLGGFGGCARDIAESLGLVEQWTKSRGDWPGRDCLGEYTPDHLQNGLTLEENTVLAQTPHIAEGVALISQGVRRLLGHDEGHAERGHA